MERDRYIKATILIKDDGTLKDLFVKPKRQKVVNFLRQIFQPPRNTLIYYVLIEMVTEVKEISHGKCFDFEVLHD